MTFSWINWVSPNYKDKCLYKGEEKTWTYRRGYWRWRLRPQRCSHSQGKPRNVVSPQTLEQMGMDSPSVLPEGPGPCQHLEFGGQVCRTGRECGIRPSCWGDLLQETRRWLFLLHFFKIICVCLFVSPYFRVSLMRC